MERVLNLTLKKIYFDEILSGEKKIEYRETKWYWNRRLLDVNGDFVKFDKVVFRNGYSSDSPKMEVECKGIDIGHCPLWGKDTYRIYLGKILSIETNKMKRSD
jgi:hypothetical protein